MTDAIYGCDGCRTTIGRMGCPTHRDKPAPTPGVNLYITTSIHGVDLRLVPRCYLCRPEQPAPAAPLDREDLAMRVTTNLNVYQRRIDRGRRP